jgi:hypothetical protein
VIKLKTPRTIHQFTGYLILALVMIMALQIPFSGILPTGRNLVEGVISAGLGMVLKDGIAKEISLVDFVVIANAQ